MDWDFVLRLQQAGVRLVYEHEALSDYVLSDRPDRVSLQKKSYLVSVEWFRSTGDLVPAADQQYFFFRNYPMLGVLRAPLSMGIATVQVIALSPVNGVREAVLAVWRAFHRRLRPSVADPSVR
ncbi:hypothetical protein [Ancylobacter sp.]|uniref:hypothetical protein n=1 Tax=Ancylobacter sp. TaxID=1872567 RepID=UPI003D105622